MIWAHVFDIRNLNSLFCINCWHFTVKWNHICKINIRLHFLYSIMLYLEHLTFFFPTEGMFFLFLSPEVHDRYECFHNLKWTTKSALVWNFPVNKSWIVFWDLGKVKASVDINRDIKCIWANTLISQ